MQIEFIQINLSSQKVRADTDQGVRWWPCSSAEQGAGEQNGSGCTPRGLHRIRAVIGRGLPNTTVFRGRRPTGELWTPALHAASPGRDWILGRILWLCGEEPGRNRGGLLDTQRRLIYLHGTPPTEPMGIAKSHGCIRLRLQDICELADAVVAGCPVDIVES